MNNQLTSFMNPLPQVGSLNQMSHMQMRSHVLNQMGHINQEQAQKFTNGQFAMALLGAIKDLEACSPPMLAQTKNDFQGGAANIYNALQYSSVNMYDDLRRAVSTGLTFYSDRANTDVNNLYNAIAKMENDLKEMKFSLNLIEGLFQYGQETMDWKPFVILFIHFESRRKEVTAESLGLTNEQLDSIIQKAIELRAERQVEAEKKSEEALSNVKASPLPNNGESAI